MEEMDLFENPRYRVNVLFLRILGQWPLSSKTEGRIMKFLYVTFSLSQVFPQFRRCILEPTAKILMATFPPIIVAFISLVKVINSTVKADKIEKMLILMQDEWRTMKEGPQLDIMTKFADNGQRLSIGYLILFYNFMVVFLLLPMRPKIMVWLGLKEGHTDFEFPYPLDYAVNSDKYFYAIEFHVIFCSTLVITALVAIDALFIVFVQHACSMFASISYRLENLTDASVLDIDLYPSKTKDSAFSIIADCIQKHNKAIEFAELLEVTYSWSLFFVVGLNTALMTFSGIQVVSNLDNMDELFRYAPFAFGQMIHVFIESAISQQVMNYSAQVDESIIMIKWYALSMRSRKLLNLMSMRSRVICQITAGKIFVMSMEFFGTVLKTSMSYFTLLREKYFDEYCSFNKRVLSALGQWPLESTMQHQIITTALLISTTFQIIAEINVLFYIDPSRIISDTVAVYIFNLCCIVKASNNYYFNDKITTMLTHIKEYWEDPNVEKIQIRHEYAKRGRMLSIVWLCVLWGTMSVFLLAPCIQKFLGYLGLLEEPAAIEFPYPAVYFIDDRKYFTILYIHIVFTVISLGTLIGGIDSLYFVFIQHACGMFAEIRWHLENLVTEETLDISLNPDKHEDHVYRSIGKLVRKHNKAIEFCEMIETSYCWAFLLVIGLNTVMISTTCLQISHSFEHLVMEDILRLAAFVLGQLGHLGFECYVSQDIIDHSYYVGEAVINSKWYLMSLRARKLLNLITIRSQSPCVVTAGSFFTMSIAFFGDVIGTSMSYFTLLQSME